MKEFFERNKLFIIILVVTCGLVWGGISLMTKGSSQGTYSTKSASMEVLLPESSHKTAGISEDSYLAATDSAKVTLVEFGDYVCPACGNYAPIVTKILNEFAGQITYSFRNYPLSYHTNALPAAYAAEAAGYQGKYWEMHDMLFSSQGAWSELGDPTDTFVGYAKDLGLDTEQFLKDFGSDQVKSTVEADRADGNLVGITETPTFYLNGAKVTLSGDPNQMATQISKLLE